MRGSVEDGELAEELARAEDRHDRGLGPELARKNDLDRATCQHEQRITRVALMEDRLAAAEPADPKDSDERIEDVLAGRPKQTTGAERLPDHRVVGNGHRSTSARSSDRKVRGHPRTHPTRCESDIGASHRRLPPWRRSPV